MSVNLIKGGSTFESTSPAESRSIFEDVLREQRRERAADRAKKDMEVMLPIQPAATSVFLGPSEVAGMPDEGYVWSLKLVSVNFAAAGTFVAYKATSTSDVRRPLGSVPAQPGVTYTTMANPSIPASTVAVQNTTNQTEQVVIVGGTITAVIVNGITVGTAAGTYFVPAYGAISITYSVIPTSWTWTATQTSVPGLTTATLTWSSDAGRLRHSEGLYLVCTSNITQVYARAWQVPSEMAAEVYD